MDEENFIHKLDLSENQVADICKHHESVYSFCEKYLHFFCGDKKEKVKIPKSVASRIINYFDLSNAYTGGEHSGYGQLVADIFRIDPGFATFFPLDEYVNLAMDDSLSNQDKDIVKNFYGLEGRKKKIEDMAMQYHMDVDNIITIIKKSVRRLATGKKNSQLQLLSRNIIKKKEFEDILSGLLGPEDVFDTNEYNRASKKKCQLVYSVLEKQVATIVYNGDFSYILDGFRLKNTIKRSILSEEDKKKLLTAVDEKLAELQKDNNNQINKCIRSEIEKAKQDGTNNRNIRALKKYISYSGLDSESISAYISQLPEDIKDKKEFLFKNNLSVRIKFPQRELMVDNLEIPEKVVEACRKSGFNNVGQIIVFSRNELRKIGAMRKIYVDDVLDALEKIGYDIPEDEDISLEEYNQDKIYDDSYVHMVADVEISGLEIETKNSIINYILAETIQKLENEYQRLNRIIYTYNDVFKTHDELRIETADECKYSRKIKEAETTINKVKNQLDTLRR